MSDAEIASQPIHTAGIDLVQENEFLKRSLYHLKCELDKYKRNPSLIGEVKGFHNGKPLVKINNSIFIVEIADGVKLGIRDKAIVEQRSLTVIGKLDSHSGSGAESFILTKQPSTKWEDIAGNEHAITELKEVVELPLLKPELFQKIGITAPKGVLLYGPPGCGKTLMAKALASSTKSFFIEITGSELVQKYIGEGSKLVKEVFELARKKAPSIVFIDEIDSIAAVMSDASTPAEREVHRTFIQLLAELDGFRTMSNVKVIAATNRVDVLDPALLRPGRMERQIKVDVPDADSRHKILKLYSDRMNLKKVNLKGLVDLTEGLSGAELHGLCTEAGYFAIRDSRDFVSHNDFSSALEKIFPEEEENYKEMFG